MRLFITVGISASRRGKSEHHQLERSHFTIMDDEWNLGGKKVFFDKGKLAIKNRPGGTNDGPPVSLMLDFKFTFC